MPRTSCGVPAVRPHRVRSPGTPPDTMSVEPESSASFMAAGLLNACQETFTSETPSARACFSMSPRSSITLNCR